MQGTEVTRRLPRTLGIRGHEEVTKNTKCWGHEEITETTRHLGYRQVIPGQENGVTKLATEICALRSGGGYREQSAEVTMR
jgi:hypothetical protein